MDSAIIPATLYVRREAREPINVSGEAFEEWLKSFPVITARFNDGLYRLGDNGWDRI